MASVLCDHFGYGICIMISLIASVFSRIIFLTYLFLTYLSDYVGSVLSILSYMIIGTCVVAYVLIGFVGV